MPVAPTPEPRLDAAARRAGFAIESIIDLPELAGHAVMARHAASGARLLHLRRDDPEHLFAVAFRTPPPDDTGLPHILEHTVLCGSKRFPVKDPFVELLKTSLATFLNAYTSPDHTVYPCASTNERDFFNLMRVYLDACFHPLLAEAFFKQEGSHLEFARPGDPESPLVVAGVVYNEMKGAYSDLDGVMERETLRRLYPDNIYGRNAGGDPDHIPGLAYPKFLEFHRTYYHPSNAWFFLHTPLATSKLLAFLHGETLSGFEAIDIDTRIIPHPRRTFASRHTVSYPATPDSDGGEETAVSLLFAANDLRDSVATLAMKVIDHYLLANDASPLRKAIVDSRLGDDLGGSGYAAYLLDTLFEVSLKGTSPDRVDAFVDLVLDVCRREADNGFDPEKLAASFQQAEFAAREIGSHYPLRLMERVYGQWLYDADPLKGLRLGEQLSELHRRRKDEPRFFENALRRWIVDNPHRSVIVFAPDPGHNALREREFAERMEKEKAGLSRGRLEDIARESRELTELQSRPNTPEALAALPRLALADVPAEPLPLPTEAGAADGRPLLRVDAFSGGVSILNLAFDCSDLPDDLVDRLPLLAAALGRMGAAGMNFERMATREARWTGGISFGAGVRSHVSDPAHPHLTLVASLHALDDHWEMALEVFGQRLLECDFSDRDHLRDIVTQTRTQVRSGILAGGNQYAALRAASRVSAGAALSERLGGFTQVRLLDRLDDRFEDEADALRRDFERLRQFMVERRRSHAAFLGGDAAWARTGDWFRAALGRMAAPDDSAEPARRGAQAAVGSHRSGMAFPSEVAFVARALPGTAMTHPDAPALLLLASQLSFGYLWNEIRVKGGAYGARASFSSDLGLLTLSTYRDPSVARTLKAFDGIGDHIEREMELTPPALEQAIIGTIKSLDAPLRPAQACGMALARHLTGATDAIRKNFRERLLRLDADAVRSAGRAYFNLETSRRAPVCVLADARRLAEENRAMPDAALEIETL